MPHPISRREIIAGAAFVPLSSIRAASPRPAPVFSAAQRRALEAAIARLIPADDLGPGALEAGAADYIERALGGHLAQEKAGFLERLAAMDAYARSAHGAPFADLPDATRDAILTAMHAGAAPGFEEASAAFTRLWQLTREGMFGDPWYGGNRNFAGWDLIRYPGPRLAVAEEDQRLDAHTKPLRVSAREGVRDGH